MRVVIYTRVSTRKKRATTDPEEHQRMVQDTENQAAQLREFAKEKGWIIAHEYTDRASGKSLKNRTQFVQMMHDAENRQFDIVLFWALDRFCREGTLPSLVYLDQLARSGVDFVSHQEQYLQSMGVFKDAIIGLLAAIARVERERIVARIKAGLEIARSKGRHVGKPLKRINEARLGELLREGCSIRSIALKLDQPEATIRRRIRRLGLTSTYVQFPPRTGGAASPTA